MKFLAIDFETANYDEYSACALGLVSVQDMVITEETHWLIRPRTNTFSATIYRPARDNLG